MNEFQCRAFAHDNRRVILPPGWLGINYQNRQQAYSYETAFTVMQLTNMLKAISSAVNFLWPLWAVIFVKPVNLVNILPYSYTRNISPLHKKWHWEKKQSSLSNKLQLNVVIYKLQQQQQYSTLDPLTTIFCYASLLFLIKACQNRVNKFFS